MRYILDSVIAALVENPDRKFIYVRLLISNGNMSSTTMISNVVFLITVSICFTMMNDDDCLGCRWDEQTEAVQAQVCTIVENGQLELINDGWFVVYHYCYR